MQTRESRPKKNRAEWDSKERVLKLWTWDTRTAQRWLKAGLPVTVDESGEYWTMELTTASPRLRWIAVFRFAFPEPWFPKYKGHRPGRFKGNRRGSGAIVVPRQGNGLASVFEALGEPAVRYQSEEDVIARLPVAPKEPKQGLPWRDEPEDYDSEPNPDDM